jgi:hypothetical protein
MPDEPSWEEIVNRVTISSNYLMLQSSAELWEISLRRMEAVADRIRELARRTRESWTGPGAEAFYAHLERLASALDQVKMHHQAVVPGLRAAAGHLETAVRTIPIPDQMVPQVRDRQAMYSRAGVIDGVEPGLFRRFYISIGYEDFFGYYSSSARAAYRTLCSEYERDVHSLPAGTPVDVPGVNRDGAHGPTTATRRPGPLNQTLPPGMMNQPFTGVPGTGMPATGLPETGMPPPTGLPPTSELPELPDDDLSEFPTGGTRLAGAGKLGGGVGGIGGPDGIPIPDIGPAVSPGAMAGGQTAFSSAAGRTATAGGLTAGHAATAMGMAPMVPPVGGPANPTGETGSQLIEDDKQIFGPGNQDLPSGVLD